MSLGRALSIGLSLFRFRWPALLAAAAIFLLPVHLFALAMNLAYGEQLFLWQESISRSLASPLAPPPTELPVAAVAMMLLASFVDGLGAMLATAASVYLVAWTYGGSRPSVGRAVRESIGRLPSLLGGMIVASLAVLAILLLGGLLVALVVLPNVGGVAIFLALVAAVSAVAAVVFLTARWTLFAQAVMVEGAGAVGGLGRSWRVAAGSTWRVLGYLLVLLLLGGLIGLAVGLLTTITFGAGFDWQALEPRWDPIATAGQVIATAVATVLIQPFVAAVLTLLYFDLRLKRGETLEPPVS